MGLQPWEKGFGVSVRLRGGTGGGPFGTEVCGGAWRTGEVLRPLWDRVTLGTPWKGLGRSFKVWEGDGVLQGSPLRCVGEMGGV